MQNKIIMATAYPIVSVDSVRFVSKIVTDSSKGGLSVITTSDPLCAQRFGSEVTMITEWLQKSYSVKMNEEGQHFVYASTDAIEHSNNSFDDGRNYATVDLVVQINSSYEKSKLYEEFKEAGYTFKQEGGGYLVTVGTCEGRPICITPAINVVAGINVLYLEPTSGMVNWEKIETWVKSKVPKGTPILNCPSSLRCRIRDLLP